MDKIISELESLLPGKPPKFVLAISTLLSVALYNLPVYDILATGIERVELRSLTVRLLLAGSILLAGFVTLAFLLAYHNKKVTSQHAELKSTLDVVSTDAQENSKSAKQLQTLLAASAQERDTLIKSHAALVEQNKDNIAQIDMLSNAADGLREELNRMAAHHNDSRKEIVKLQDDFKSLQQQYSESERLCNERKFLLDVAEKKIAELSKPIETASASSAPGPDDYHAPRRSFFHSDNDRPKRR
jgi:ABC-type multidrug transport system fused ATPase/permease subunit